jgi:hypothetical protein
MLMMIINPFILLTSGIIVLLNGNVMQKMEKLLQVEMEEEIDGINWIDQQMWLWIKRIIL